MGGKGKKRREKNYRAAHGDSTRLPPLPVTSSLDALPSKLRQLLALTSPVDDEHKVKRTANGGKRSGIKKADANVGSACQNKNRDDGDEHDSADQKKNKKRKKTQAPKKPFDASQERKQLQAVEAYRSRKQWTSRPGVHLPPAIEDS